MKLQVGNTVCFCIEGMHIEGVGVISHLIYLPTVSAEILQLKTLCLSKKEILIQPRAVILREELIRETD